MEEALHCDVEAAAIRAAVTEPEKKTVRALSARAPVEYILAQLAHRRLLIACSLLFYNG